MIKKFCAKDLALKEDKKLSVELDEFLNSFSDDEVKATGNTVGELEFKLRNNFVIVTGSFATPLELKCGRCTKPYNINLDVEVDEAIEVNDNIAHTEETELDAESVHEQITSTEVINVTDLAEQYIILNLPTKKLCSEDCVNENLEKYNPENRDNVDPRWEELLKYKDKIKGE